MTTLVNSLTENFIKLCFVVLQLLHVDRGTKRTDRHDQGKICYSGNMHRSQANIAAGLKRSDTSTSGVPSFKTKKTCTTINLATHKPRTILNLFTKNPQKHNSVHICRQKRCLSYSTANTHISKFYVYPVFTLMPLIYFS
jgi:hypothetical protein